MPPLDPVIHQQSRLQILAVLYRNGRASFTDLRDGIGLTAGNLASHATRLEEKGYIRAMRRLSGAGLEAQYAITRDGCVAFEAYLESLVGLVETATGNPLPKLAGASLSHKQ